MYDNGSGSTDRMLNSGGRSDVFGGVGDLEFPAVSEMPAHASETPCMRLGDWNVTRSLLRLGYHWVYGMIVGVIERPRAEDHRVRWDTS